MSVIDNFLAACTDAEPLPNGGQKQVSKATHKEYGPVAIKQGTYGVSESLDRIAREVVCLSKIDSRYYPKHYEFIVDPVASQFLIAEEFLDASELGMVLDKFDSEDKVYALLVQLVTALEIVWSQKVVHRDLKPQNILITEDLEPRIIDLGIARFLDQESLTRTMAICGPATPMYASPEQLRNNKNMINHRSDFFNLGILVYELIVGKHPFDPNHVGSGASYVENILNGNRAELPTTARAELKDFIDNVLQVAPYNRFKTPKMVKNCLGMEQ